MSTRIEATEEKIVCGVVVMNGSIKMTQDDKIDGYVVLNLNATSNKIDKDEKSMELDDIDSEVDNTPLTTLNDRLHVATPLELEESIRNGDRYINAYLTKQGELSVSFVEESTAYLVSEKTTKEVKRISPHDGTPVQLLKEINDELYFDKESGFDKVCNDIASVAIREMEEACESKGVIPNPDALAEDYLWMINSFARRYNYKKYNANKQFESGLIGAPALNIRAHKNEIENLCKQGIESNQEKIDKLIDILYVNDVQDGELISVKFYLNIDDNDYFEIFAASKKQVREAINCFIDQFTVADRLDEAFEGLCKEYDIYDALDDSGWLDISLNRIIL